MNQNLKQILDNIIHTSLVLTKFTNTIVKSRPLKDIGAEQVIALSSWPRQPSDPLSISASHRSPISQGMPAQIARRFFDNFRVHNIPLSFSIFILNAMLSAIHAVSLKVPPD